MNSEFFTTRSHTTLRNLRKSSLDLLGESIRHGEIEIYYEGFAWLADRVQDEFDARRDAYEKEVSFICSSVQAYLAEEEEMNRHDTEDGTEE